MYQKNSLDNHIMISSFPKSGNTWIRFLVANLYNELEKKFDEIDFHNIHDIIPEWNQTEIVQPCFSDLPLILKTHNCHNKLFKRVILVLRNPYDLFLSYFHYLNNEEQKDLKISEIVYHKTYGVKALVEHTNSFLKKRISLLILTYENFHSEPYKEMKRICEFLELNVSEQIVEVAVEKSRFEVMRKIELKKGRKYGNKSFLFTRSGKIGEGLAEFGKNSKLFNYIKIELEKSALHRKFYL